MLMTSRFRYAWSRLVLAASLAAILMPAHSRAAEESPRSSAPSTMAVVDTAARRAARDSVARAASRKPDFSGLQALLDEYLVVVSKRGEPLDTRFDYEKLYDARGRRARMVLIGDQLMTPRPSLMDPKTRLAWAINTYNFAVLDIVTQNLLVPERKRLRRASVQDIRVRGVPMFMAPLLTIEGQKYSLDQFEREFVFGGYQKALDTTAPPGLDPRSHFALVCGAIGCPPLQSRVFTPEGLDEQLEAATRNALKLPRHLRINRKTGALEVSQIFNWSAADFGWHDRSIEFVEHFAPSSIRSEIKKLKLKKVGGYIDWDWKLNQVEKQKPPTS